MTGTPLLDPRFAKIVAKMRSTTHAGEREAARGRAAVVATRCGRTFEQAMAELDGHPTTSAHRDPFQDSQDNVHRDYARRSTHSAHPSQAAAPDGIDAVRAALRGSPQASDRHIARMHRCSPTTVGKVRRELGLDGVSRSVQRHGQRYDMRARRSESTSSPQAAAPDGIDAVRAALRGSPQASDRHIARMHRCSPTTVGKVRRELGLDGVSRSVQRHGQRYDMRAKRSESA